LQNKSEILDVFRLEWLAIFEASEGKTQALMDIYGQEMVEFLSKSLARLPAVKKAVEININVSGYIKKKAQSFIFGKKIIWTTCMLTLASKLGCIVPDIEYG
jgi:hypothetical protein